MNRRELNISNKKLRLNTKEDIILKSPMRIPSKEMQDLIKLKNLNISEYAYYDISKTEKQLIYNEDEFRFIFFNNILIKENEMNISLGNLSNI